jgi:quaternary ammonium compound-resistance protein SugE
MSVFSVLALLRFDRILRKDCMAVLQLVLASAAYAVGGLFMKTSAGLSRPAPVVAFLALFAGGSLLQALGMRDADMGTAYVFVLGVEAVIALGLSVVYLHERVSAVRAVAVLLVIAGVMLLRRT